MAYVFAHMFGNLKLYFGAEDLNHYSEFLRAAGAILPGRGRCGCYGSG